MYSEKRSDGSRALVTIAVLIFIGVAVWWLESRFNALTVILVIGALLGVACFAGGALLTNMTQRHTMENLAKFNANDAQVDRYRMQGFKEMARGDAAWQKANAQLALLDARRVDQLAQQRAGILVDAQRQPAQDDSAQWWNTPPSFCDDE
jgi:hypothetical protein